MQGSTLGALTPIGFELHDAGDVERSAGDPIDDDQAPPDEIRLQVELDRPSGRMPGAKQMRAVADDERRVTGAHQAGPQHPPSTSPDPHGHRSASTAPAYAGGMTAFTAHNGFQLPAIGFGTFGLWGDAGADAVSTAIDVGYRLIDSAFNYENEGSVGRGRRRIRCRPLRDHRHDQAPRPPPPVVQGAYEHRGEPFASRRRDDRSAPHPLAEPDPGRVRPGVGGARRRAAARRPPGAHRARDRRPPGGEPDRGAPVLPAGRAARVPPRARHHHRGLEPARQGLRRSRRACDHRDRGSARHHPGADRAGLARRPRHGRDPEGVVACAPGGEPRCGIRDSRPGRGSTRSPHSDGPTAGLFGGDPATHEES
ncbi:hypothetical protein HA402_006749 [Bradysia odoriphaga]|nr:hypothetical protein HA402_006749 [Bradysia odoriphaga]